MRVFSPEVILPVVSFSKIFFYTLETLISRNTWECLLFIFFTAMCQATIYSPYFFVSSKKITRPELVSYKLVTFNSDWQIHHNTARHTHNNLSFLVPPPTLTEHIYGVSVIPRKGIFQISPGWLPLLLLFWFNHLYHRYSGEAFSHSLKEVIEDRRKRGKNRKKNTIQQHSVQ